MNQRWARLGLWSAIAIAIGSAAACGGTAIKITDAREQDGLSADIGGGGGRDIGSGGSGTVSGGAAGGGGGVLVGTGGVGDAGSSKPDGVGGRSGDRGMTGGSSGGAGTDGGGSAGGLTVSTGGVGDASTDGGGERPGDAGANGDVRNCLGSEGGSDASTQVLMLASAGAPCSNLGTLACATSDQQQQLICSADVWTKRQTCVASQRCDRGNGLCADIVPTCADHDPGYAYCEGDTLNVCGPDLVTLASIPCCGRCAAGACQVVRCGDGVVQSPEECDDGNTTPADGCENDCKRSVIVQLAAGWTQSCVLFGTGQVRCWGGNDHGQLGLGNKQDQSASMPYQLGPIALGAQVTFLAAGYRHTCALTVDGSVQCWGRNDFGQLGLGHANDIGDDELPAVSVSKVPLGVSVKQLAAGGDTTCVLLDDDTVRCWGRNDFGQLGLGHTNNIGDNELPTAANAQVSLGGTAIGLAVAGDHTCALLATNDVRCWGDNRLGELGIGNTDNIGDDELPTAADTISFNDDGQLISITAGGYHTCVHEESSMLGSISRCWGYDGDGSLGVGFIADRPLALGNDWPYSSWNFPIVQLSCGAEHTCVYLYSHDLRCFGGNEVAQLGLPNIYSLGDVGPPIAASPIDFGVDAKGGPVYTILFATGALHNCAQVNTGDVHCWGMNADGQLGLGYSSPGQYGYVGGDPQSVPGKLPAVQIFPPGR